MNNLRKGSVVMVNQSKPLIVIEIVIESTALDYVVTGNAARDMSCPLTCRLG